MQLSDHDLNQLDEDKLLDLPEEDLRRLSIRLLNDLKEARERLKQNSRNSSRPPSSEAPWDKANDTASDTDAIDAGEDTSDQEADNTSPAPPAKESKQDSQTDSSQASDNVRKPGKQPGAQGFGRQQVLPVTDYQDHRPELCACCGTVFTASQQKAYTAFDTVDLTWADANDPGLRLITTRHTYYEATCRCDHVTRDEPYRHMPHGSLPNVVCSEWRLVGPGLAALIVCLAYRMRLSRERIREFLQDWLGLSLSVGTINNTLHESGAAALPIEDELIEAVVNSQLLHVDETSWMELTTFLWLWVFSTDSVTAYWIAYRSAELLENLLGADYLGWLMSDGYQAYRRYPNRVRCWAHLLRKAQGLEESFDPVARQFGKQTLALLNTLMNAIREARVEPPDKPLTETFQEALAIYRALCESLREATHKKTRELACEMLNDWDAIFQVVASYHLPLTNNEAERALRHWVILRRISYGTRTEQGSRVFAILISVIETCRKRQQSPWLYLAVVIDHQRTGRPIPKLPPVVWGSE